MIIYIDMDDVLCDFTTAYKRDITLNPSILYPQSQYGFFTKLVPIKDAIESVKALILSDIYTPYILTAPSIRNPLSYTEKRIWIEDKFGLDFVDRLIICSNKALLKGDYLIDDYCEGKGQEGFEGELIHFGTKSFADWRVVMEYLEF